jgi:phenylpyruvate tautomerase PptA (4-oxalocrotonate tautomerase family)
MDVIEGENMRELTLVLIDEGKRGDWGVGGKSSGLAAGKSKG